MMMQQQKAMFTGMLPQMVMMGIVRCAFYTFIYLIFIIIIIIIIIIFLIIIIKYTIVHLRLLGFRSKSGCHCPSSYCCLLCIVARFIPMRCALWERYHKWLLSWLLLVFLLLKDVRTLFSLSLLLLLLLTCSFFFNY